MNKLDKELYIKHAKRLSVIINPQSPFARYLAKPEFIKGIKLQLNILAVLEKRFAKEAECDIKAENLVKTFNELTKQEFEIDTKFKLDDDGDYIDAINYLHMYCKNIFKVDIDELAEGKKVTVSAPDINLGKDARADSAPEMDPSAFMGAAAAMEGMDGMINPFAYAQATTRLNKEVSSGQIYQFKSKPKVIPIAKLILSVLLFLIVAAALITCVFVFITNQMNIKSATSEDIIKFPAVSYALFYIIVAGFTLYVGITNTQQIVAGKKNENYKYSFSWAFYVAALVLVLFISLMDLRITWFLHNDIPDKTQFKYVVGFTGWKYMIIVNCGLVALALVPTIIGAVKNPKVDSDKMAGLLKQYMEEITPATGMPQTPDVQKPVDVKPTKDKKEKDSKDKEDTPLKS